MSYGIGFDDAYILQALNELARSPGEVRDGLRVALKRTARDIVDTARKKHRFRTRSGALERAAEFRVSDDDLRAEVFLNEATAPHAKYVHGGTRPHVIRPKKRKVLRWVAGGRFVFARRVRHPGTKPDPFLYEAAEDNRKNLQERCLAVMKRLGKEADK